MEHKELTERIIGCAFKVYKEMGFGFLESVYEKCLLIELRNQGLPTESRSPVVVHYHEEIVGEFVVDLLVMDLVVVELKSVRSLVAAHEVQLVNYLKATRLDVGLLINFGETKVDVKRKTRSLSLGAELKSVL
jgi:GxxExxY protein